MTEGTTQTGDPRFVGRYDTSLITQTASGFEAHRQHVVLSDPTAAAGAVTVTNASAGVNDYGLVVRPAGSGDSMLDIARGLVANISHVNKFGENADIDTAAVEDIWTGGGTWVAPTQARLHDIVSTDAADTSAGAGAKTVRVYGLTGWSTAEVSEDITMNGVTNVPTVNSYVIIHRVKVLTKGASGPNAGVITATAQTDATVTARIEIGQGQTLMAIYGIPSVQTLYMTQYYASVLRAQAASADVHLLVNPEPDAELTGFLTKHTAGANSAGTTMMSHDFKPYYSIPGPAIIKIRCGVSANNTSMDAGFDGMLVTNA